MSQLINDSRTPNQTSAPPAAHRPVWIVLGSVLWGLVLVMGLVVWLAGRRARAVVEPPAEPAAIQIATETQAAPQKPAPALWDQTGVKDFTFTERSGRQVTKADLLGHPWLVSFIFTRCAGPCPKVSGRMSDLQRLLAGTDVKLVTLTVDPDFDKPDVLNRYAQSFGADANRWLYLTGDKEKTYRLINDSFKMPVKEMTGRDREPGYEVLHSVNILRVNEQGVVVAKYNALDDADVARLEHDLRPYIEQAKQNRPNPENVTPAKGAVR